ncbi:MAG TPA: hypothetical protein VMF30_18400 [Pirellulales bacterium]|nr:hypothetical protein [Pirellulales bacterium]
MRQNRKQVGHIVACGTILLALFFVAPALAAERTATNQPVLTPGGPYTRLLGAAPLKPPVLFADDDDAVAAKMEIVGWYHQGMPSYAYYRGYGGWYGPWYGYRSYPYWGGYHGGYYGYLGGAPFGYYGAFAPFGYPYYGWGYRAWGPYYTSYAPAFAAPYFTGAAGYVPPYAPCGFGGCSYW